ncbi:neuroligin [Holotrichia oblita]|uniref:Neuroligin n=1 Tax=Holotrichia oblita TaxID=644536 RepID=A0ACB9THD8_HOLOL|nr:neuroligin [Holotrichia oblita]
MTIVTDYGNFVLLIGTATIRTKSGIKKEHKKVIIAYSIRTTLPTIHIKPNIHVAGDNPHYNEYENGKPQKTEPQNAINILNNVLLRKSVVSKLSRYDLMLGVVKAEAYFAFNGEDVQYGIEADRRSKILRTFVRNTYSYHLSEILATIVNEYTDWERPVQHPINIRDETLEALSDAQYVAPVVHTADLHSAEHRNSYLYVFDYQTKFGDYPQVREDLLNLFYAC